MSISMCTKCSKMISISVIPGGNPTAKAHPGLMATSYGLCERCGAMYCDECIQDAGGKCPGCGRRIELQGPLPGQTADLPGDMHREALTEEKPSRGGRGGLLFGLILLSAIAAVAWYVTSAESLIHGASWIVLNVLGVLAVFAIVSPLVGQFLTGLIGEPLRRILDPSAMYGFCKLGISLYVIVLIASPLFIYFGLKTWELAPWVIAYSYAGIVGFALLGGLPVLLRYRSSLTE